MNRMGSNRQVRSRRVVAAVAALGLALASCSDGGVEAEDGIEGQNESDGAIVGDGEGSEEDDSAVPEDFDTDPGIVERDEDDDSAVPDDFDTDPGIVEQDEDDEGIGAG